MADSIPAPDSSWNTHPRREQLADFLHRRMDQEADAVRVAVHLSNCAACRAVYAQLPSGPIYLSGRPFLARQSVFSRESIALCKMAIERSRRDTVHGPVTLIARAEEEPLLYLAFEDLGIRIAEVREPHVTSDTAAARVQWDGKLDPLPELIARFAPERWEQAARVLADGESDAAIALWHLAKGFDLPVSAAPGVLEPLLEAVLDPALSRRASYCTVPGHWLFRGLAGHWALDHQETAAHLEGAWKAVYAMRRKTS